MINLEIVAIVILLAVVSYLLIERSKRKKKSGIKIMGDPKPHPKDNPIFPKP